MDDCYLAPTFTRALNLAPYSRARSRHGQQHCYHHPGLSTVTTTPIAVTSASMKSLATSAHSSFQACAGERVGLSKHQEPSHVLVASVCSHVKRWRRN